MEEREREEGNKRKRMRVEEAKKDTVVKNVNSIFRVIDTEGMANSLPSVKDEA